MSVEFEKKLAYCFGVPNREAVLAPFIAALQCVRNDAPQEALAQLEAAYQVVHDNGWPHINVKQAARNEYDMILAMQHNAAEHDALVEGMMDLYAALYDRDREDFRSAAELRTFLSRYKHSHGESLVAGEKEMLLGMARLSEELLLELRK